MINQEGARSKQLPSNSQTLDQSKLFDDLGYTTGTNGAATFADSKAKAFFHSDWVDEFTTELNIVARHNHFGALWKMCNTGNVGGAEVELRTIAIEEWGMTAPSSLVRM